MGSRMWSVLNQMCSQCFLRNFAVVQEELRFAFKRLGFWRAKCSIFGQGCAEYFSGSPPAYCQSFTTQIFSRSQIFPLQFCPLDLLCRELMLYRFFMALPSQVLSWCPEWHWVFSSLGNEVHTAGSSAQPKLRQTVSDCCIIFFTVQYAAWAGFHGEHSKCVSN